MAGGRRSAGCCTRTSRPICADDLLVKTDRCTMANSLEARSPFLDRALDGVRRGAARRSEAARAGEPRSSCARRLPICCRRRSSAAARWVSACRSAPGSAANCATTCATAAAPGARYRDMLSGAFVEGSSPAIWPAAPISASSSGPSSASRGGCGCCRNGRHADAGFSQENLRPAHGVRARTADTGHRHVVRAIARAVGTTVAGRGSVGYLGAQQPGGAGLFAPDTRRAGYRPIASPPKPAAPASSSCWVRELNLRASGRQLSVGDAWTPGCGCWRRRACSTCWTDR